MRPNNPKQTKLNRRQARAEMVLSHTLSWCPGYPTAWEDGAVVWQSADGQRHNSSTIRITRQTLREAEEGVSRLRHRFPKVLSRVVEDPPKWIVRMDRALSILKGWVHQSVHHGDELVADIMPTRCAHRFRQLEQQANADPNGMQSTLRALSFVILTSVHEPTLETVEWLERNYDVLSRLSKSGLQLPLLWFHFRNEAPESLGTALADATVGESSNCELAGLRAWLVKIDDIYCKWRSDPLEVEFPPRPEGHSLRRYVTDMMQHAVTCSEKPRRRLFRLLSLVLTDETTQRLKEYQALIDFGKHNIKRALRKVPLDQIFQRRQSHISDELNTRLKQSDADCDALRIFLGDISPFSQRAPIDWLRLFEALPGDAVRPQIVIRTLQDWKKRRQWKATAGYGIAVNALGTQLQRSPAFAKVLTEQLAEVRHNFLKLIEDIVWHGRKRIVDTMRMLQLALMHYGLELNEQLVDNLHECSKSGLPDDVSIPLLQQLTPEFTTYLHAQTLALAVQLTESLSAASGMYAGLDSASESTLDAVRRIATEDPLRGAVGAAVLNADWASIERATAAANLVQAFGGACPRLSANEVDDAQWIQSAPSILHAPLKDLCRLTDSAKRIAANMLGRDLPVLRDCTSELAFLDAKIQQLEGAGADTKLIHLRARRDNLVRYLESPQLPSPERLKRLRLRLDSRVALLAIETFVERCQEEVQRLLAEGQLDESDHAGKLPRLPATSPCALPASIWRPPLCLVASGVAELKPPDRSLGIWLLRYAIAGETRVFDSLPQNQQYLEKVRELGVDVEPWLSEFSIPAKTEDGTPYDIAFTREVKDILLMGHHFGTCLSPRNMNFFATLANTVDVNKRVVYGKTADGKVVGRCLFALTDDGAVLTYHRYAHNPDDDFAAGVNSFRDQLLAAMGACETDKGRVPTLVASRWYSESSRRRHAVSRFRFRRLPNDEGQRSRGSRGDDRTLRSRTTSTTNR